MLLAMGMLAWGGALLLEKRRTKPVLAAVLLVCLAPLLLFKYFNFFSDSLAALSGILHLSFSPLYLQWGAPAGISYYTFLMVSYLVDVYRKKCAAERNALLCVTSFSLFLQITAGPLTRPCDLLPQLNTPRSFDTKQAIGGAQLAAFGLFKKLALAQTISAFAEPVFYDPQKLHGMSIIIAVFLYAVQIYADFSGYTDVARGLGRMLGFALCENFRSPYFSQSIKEFWARWHISLSSWLKDYVYIPLGGSRRGEWKTRCNLLATFLVSGLWHGASWTFVIWGGLHGLGQIVEKEWNRRFPPKKDRRSVIRVFLVFAFVCIAWIFFRANTFSDAVYVLTHLFDGVLNPVSYIRTGYTAFQGAGLMQSFDLKLAFVWIAVLLAHDYIELKQSVWTWLGRFRGPVRYAFYFALLFVVLYSRQLGEYEFVYFQF